MLFFGCACFPSRMAIIVRKFSSNFGSPVAAKRRAIRVRSSDDCSISRAILNEANRSPSIANCLCTPSRSNETMTPANTIKPAKINKTINRIFLIVSRLEYPRTNQIMVNSTKKTKKTTMIRWNQEKSSISRKSSSELNPAFNSRLSDCTEAVTSTLSVRETIPAQRLTISSRSTAEISSIP